MSGKELFYVQIFLIIVLFYFGSTVAIAANPILFIVFIIAMLLGLFAFYNMGSKNYSPFPHPRAGAKLVQLGIYKYIRHPMYTSVMLIGLVLFLTSPTFLGFVTLTLLIGVLYIKANMEEELLTKMHSQYKDYAAKTKKFIPFVF